MATIKDVPRYAYRGLMLDACRHFMPVEFVKKYIDLIALHKQNQFHWHLPTIRVGGLRSKNILN
jgi:hexosaminidase